MEPSPKLKDQASDSGVQIGFRDYRRQSVHYTFLAWVLPIEPAIDPKLRRRLGTRSRNKDGLSGLILTGTPERMND
jgi:hypothetical protein